MARTRLSARDRIRESAAKLFLARGYDAASIQAIATKAGVAKGLVLHHYGTKNALLHAVLEVYFAAQRQAMEHAMEGVAPPRERIHAMLDGYFEFMITHHDYARLVRFLASRDDDVFKVLQAHLLPMLTWVEHVLADIVPDQPALAARQFYVTLAGVVIDYFPYSRLLAPAWPADPSSKAQLNDRRQHMHWVADALLDGLERERA